MRRKRSAFRFCRRCGGTATYAGGPCPECAKPDQAPPKPTASTPHDPCDRQAPDAARGWQAASIIASQVFIVDNGGHRRMRFFLRHTGRMLLADASPE